MLHDDTSTNAAPALCAWDRAAADAGSWTPPPRRTVVVAPHPDDEVLSTAGLIQVQAGRADVVVVAVTDGEAAYPDAPPDSARGRSSERAPLACRRRVEQQQALRELSPGSFDVRRLGLPDGGLPDAVDALCRALAGIMRPGDVVVAPWRHDHHSDHVACAEAVDRLAGDLALECYGSLFWAYHHSRPGLAGAALVRLDLSTHQQHRRWVALQAHRSQLPSERPDSVLTDALLAPLHRPYELFVAVDR